MRKMLNTLYVTNPDLYLGRDGLTLVAWLNDEKVAQFPIHNFEDIICFNYTGVSTSLLELCADKGVNITFLSRSGKFRGRFYGPVKGNVLLRKEQYRISEDPKESINFAKLFILGKTYNSARVLDRYIKEHSSVSKNLIFSKEKISESRIRILEITSHEELLGVEGDLSREYFSNFNELITSQKEDFRFNTRTRRPPLDPVNAMLSLTYSFIRVKMESALETVGLDPYVGFYHTDRPGRTGLALDMMEELRPYMGDRFILKLINNKEVTIKDFIIKENESVLFTEDGFKKFLDLWNLRMQETFKHPFLEETINVGLLPYVQAMLLARCIRKDLEIYPPFFMN